MEAANDADVRRQRKVVLDESVMQSGLFPCRKIVNLGEESPFVTVLFRRDDFDAFYRHIFDKHEWSSDLALENGIS